MKLRYNAEIVPVLDDILRTRPNIKSGKMFGIPAYKVNGKLAIGLYDDGVTAKVGESRARELIGQAGIHAFEPQPGRVWREWVYLVEANPADYRRHEALFDAAIQFVSANS